MQRFIQRFRNLLNGYLNWYKITYVILTDIDIHIVIRHLRKLLRDILHIIIDDGTDMVKRLRQPPQLILRLDINVNIQISGFQLPSAFRNHLNRIKRAPDNTVHRS